jgi:hypothetical protein
MGGKDEGLIEICLTSFIKTRNGSRGLMVTEK